MSGVQVFARLYTFDNSRAVSISIHLEVGCYGMLQSPPEGHDELHQDIIDMQYRRAAEGEYHLVIRASTLCIDCRTQNSTTGREALEHRGIVRAFKIGA